MQCKLKSSHIKFYRKIIKLTEANRANHVEK